MKFLDLIALTSANCRSENVRIKAVIIPELKLSDIDEGTFC
jgi:hypothetical protein